FGFHYENQMLAVNLFHMRGGRILDRRELFWEDLPEFELMPRSEDVERSEPADGDRAPRPEFDPGLFFSALLKQCYIDQQYVPRTILVPVDFNERLALEELLSEKR